MKTLYTIYTNFAKRLAMSLMVLMTISVGTSIAQDEIVYTLTPASGSNNSYAGNCDITINDITWNLTGNSQQIPWRIGGKSLSNTDRALYSKTAIQEDISKIVITHGEATSITVNSMTVIVSTKQNGGGTVISTLTPTFKANGDVTITRPDGKDWSKAFYKIVYNVTVSSDKNKFIEFTSAQFYKTSAPACSYTVTFNGNSNTGGAMDNQKFTCDVAQKLTANSFSRTGYTFAGWNTEADGSGDSYSNQQSVLNLADNGETITLFAQWTANKYTVKFNGNGNTGGSMNDQSFTYGTAQNLTPNAFEKYGYNFAGWATSENGNVTYSDQQSVSNLTSANDATVTLFAKWIEKGLVRYRTSCACIPPAVTIQPTSEYGWRYSIGETIGLNAIVEGASGDCTYQWQKYVVDQWQDIAGATSETFTKENCTTDDGGSYRCVVNAGNDCIAESEPYYVRVFTLNGYYYNEEIAANKIEWTGENTGVATIHLGQSRTYLFKVTDNEGKWFGYGDYAHFNYIVQPWQADCGIETGNGTNTDIRLFTGPEGDYTFTINIEHALDNEPYVNIAVAYPEVEHPVAGYGYITKWWDNCYIYWWDAEGTTLTDWGSAAKIDTYTTICGTDYYYFPILDNYINLIIKDAAGEPTDNHTTGDQTQTGHSGWYITHDGTNWGWHEFATYTITFNANGGNGTMDALSGICPTTDKTLTTNAFTRSGYTFAGWKANKNVTINGFSVVAGTLITDCATIQNIVSDITLTAQWTPKNITITWDANGGSVTPTSSTYTYNGATITPPTPTRANYIFNGWFTATSGGTQIADVGTTNKPTDDVTYYAQWTAKVTPTFAWSDATCTVTIASKNNVFPTLETTPVDLAGVKYSSSNTDVATIDANGNIILKSAGETTIRAYYEEDDTYAAAEDTYTLTVKESTNCRWEEVTIDDIEYGDEVVITMTKGAITWALQDNGGGTSNPPLATQIEILPNKTIATTITNHFIWNVDYSKDSKQLVIYSTRNAGKWLYSINDNNGIRVGTNTNKAFKIVEGTGNDAGNFFLYHIVQARYLGVYINQDWRGYTSINSYITGQTLKFYKRVCLPEGQYRVTWDADGGTWADGSTQKEEIYTVDATINKPEKPERDGYVFDHWDPTPETMPAQNTTFTAKWAEVCTVTYTVGNGDTAPAEMQAEENTNITLPSLTTNLTCVKFVGWTDAANDAAITSGNIYKAGDSYKVTQDITLKAVYAAGGGFVLVTDANDLAVGDRIVIAAAGFDVAMGADRGNNRGEVTVNKDNTDKTITTPDGIQILTLEAGTTAGTLAFNTGNGYLYAAGGTSSNQLKTTKTLDNKGSWNISISAEGIATIKSVEPTGGTARNWLRYNSSNTPPIFSCYASGQADVSIYKESITGYTTDPECEEYDITLEVIGHANGSARINGQTATSTTSQIVTILNTEKATISNVANVAGYDVTVSKRSGNATFTDNGNGTWTVSEPASNVTIQVQYTAKQIYKVQFVTGTGGTGSFTSLDAYKGQTVTIPANYEAFGLCGEFVGWTEGARASGEKPTKLYQPGDPFTLNSNGTSLYAVYSISASCTSEFALGKSGDYEMYAIYSNNVYYATPKNGSNDYFYANTEADIEANARVKSTFRMQYDATQTAAWNEQDVYAYTIYISNGSTEYGFWHLNSVGDLDFDATEPYYWKVKSYNGGYDIYGEASGKTYHITCNSSNFNARTSAGEVYFTPGGGIEYWTDIDCSDINVDVTFAWNQFESWPVGMPNANSYKGLAKCSEITEFPVALQEGWTFLGWSTKEYNALHADDLDDENNASRAYPDGSDIYKTGGNTLTLGSADITLYPVFTRYEENEPLNLVNGGEFYMYVKPGNTDVYGGVRRFYIADVNLSSGGFTSTEDCNDARPFTFIKEDAGWLIQFVDEGGKTYYLGANAADSDLTKHQTSKTYWDITVGAGNNPANAYRMMAIGQGSEDALLAKFSNGLTSATFKYYAIENLINTPSAYFDIFLGSCEDRVFSSDPTSKPSVTITGGGYVTGSKGQTVFVPSAFTITGKNLNDNYNVNIADVGGLLKFYNEAGNMISDFGKPLGGKLAQTTFYVAYTPTADTDGTEIPSIIVTNGTGGSALNQEITDLIHARHLPAEFAIVAKIGGNWYALPDTALHVQTPEGLLVEVDNVDNPTAVTQSFCNATAWSLRGVKNTRYVVNSVLNGDNVLFAETNTEVIDNRKMLYAGEDSKVGAYATYTNYTATNPDRYEWQLTTTDNITYTVNSNSTIVSDPLSVNNSRAFGTHGKFVASEEIRLLPIEGPCIAPAVFQVIEWKTNGMIIMYTGAGVSATTQVGTYAASDAKMTEVDHGVYELTTSQDLTACTGLKLAITFTDASSNKTQKVLVIPAIVSGEKGSTSLVASNAVAKVTDVVVLDDAKLTADGTQYTYNDVVVYPGGKLVIDDGKALGMYSLTLRAGSSWGAKKYENKYPQFLLKGVYSNSSGQINLDYVTTADYYYPLSVPEQVTIADIKYPVDIYGSNVEKNNKGSFQFKYYDGAQRVAQGSQYGTGWVVLDESTITTLTPNQGYALWGIPKKINGKRQTYGIHRIPIKISAGTLKTNESRDEKVDIKAHGVGKEGVSPNDQGWNYLGNPYLAGLGGMNGSDTDLQIGLLEKEIINGSWTGAWVYNQESVNSNIRYITLTHDCQNYEALPVADAVIPAFSTFFIQAVSADDQKILLTAPASVLDASSLPARRYAAEQETLKEITTGILLTGNDQTDRTGLLIADNFTEEYDFNADLSKFENSGINLYTIGKDGKLAYMAINQTLAELPIPVGYTATADGEYTIAFDEDRYSANDISALYLIDYDLSEKTNLLHTDYSFLTAAGTYNQRFALQVAFAPENATSIEWVEGAIIQVGVEGNTLLLNNLPTDAAVHVFDALGRLMYHAPSAQTEIQITLPTGYYLVRVADKQHSAVISTVIP